MPCVSIIITAYNSEKCISTAIESALKQTLQDIEIICVDDGSTDRTPEIVQQYIAGDDRIRLIRQTNNGAFSARYKGAQEAAGEYIMFMDHDDIIRANAAETLLEVAETKQADIVEFGVEIVADEQKLESAPEYLSSYRFYLDYFSYKHPIPEYPESGELINLCFDKRYITWNIWNKFCKTELVCKAWMNYKGEYIGIEDMLETLMLFCVAQHYVYYDDKLYCYHIDVGISKTGMLTNSRQTKYYGSAAIIFRLQKEWMDKLTNKPKNCEAGVAAFRRRVRNDIFDLLFYRCDVEKREEMLGWIRQCISEEEFYQEFLKYIFDNYGAQVQEIRETLKDLESLRENRYDNANDKKKKYYPLGKKLVFADEWDSDRYIVTGMYEAEPWGRWSKGKETKLQFYFDENVENDLIVHMEYSVLNGDQRVEIYANDQKIVSYEDKEEFVKHDIRIPNDLLMEGWLRLRFELPDAVCPFDRDGCGDKRTLAIGLSGMTIDVCDSE